MKKNIPSTFDLFKDQVVSGKNLVGGEQTYFLTEVDCPDGVENQCCYISDEHWLAIARSPNKSPIFATFPQSLSKVFGVNTHISVNPITGVTTVRKVSNRRF